jgi:Tfp pilus assembly protein PilF
MSNDLVALSRIGLIALTLAIAGCAEGAGSRYESARYGLTQKIENGLTGDELAKAYLTRAATWESDGYPANALADYDQAIATAPQMAEAYEARAYHWRLQNQPDRAIADASSMIELLPANDASGHMLRAELRLNTGDYRGAVADYSEALERDPKRWPAYGGRGVALAALNEEDQALPDLDRAVKLNTGNLGTRTVKRCYLYQAQTTPNCKDEGELLSSQAFMEHVYWARGLILFHKADYQRAIPDLERGPFRSDAWVYQGLSRMALGDCRAGYGNLERYEYLTDKSLEQVLETHHDFIMKTTCADYVF